jgi:hypothetical protein
MKVFLTILGSILHFTLTNNLKLSINYEKHLACYPLF